MALTLTILRMQVQMSLMPPRAPLRLRYITAVNRGQREIDTSTPSSRSLLLRDTKVNITSQLRRISVAWRAARHGNSSSMAAPIVLDIYTESTNEFYTVMDCNTTGISFNELSGGAHISFVFHELFDAGVKSIGPFDQVKDGDIRNISYNSSVRAVFLLLPSTDAEG
jgi:hypothetical protein